MALGNHEFKSFFSLVVPLNRRGKMLTQDPIIFQHVPCRANGYHMVNGILGQIRHLAQFAGNVCPNASRAFGRRGQCLR